MPAQERIFMKNKSQKKQRAIFNAVDAGILLVLLAILLVSVYFLFFADHIVLGDWTQENGNHTVVYTLELKGVDNDLLTETGELPIVKGDALYHIDASFSLGRVISISAAAPCLMATSQTDSNGDLVYAPFPNHSSFTIEVETVAAMVDGCYVVNGKTLRVGETFKMATPYFESSVYCKDVREVTGNE